MKRERQRKPERERERNRNICVSVRVCVRAQANKSRRTAREGVNVPYPNNVNYLIAFPRDSLHLSSRTYSCHFHTHREIMINIQYTHIHIHPYTRDTHTQNMFTLLS